MSNVGPQKMIHFGNARLAVALLTILLAPAIAAPEKIPSSVFGTYTFEQTKLCNVGNVRPDGSFDWVDCHKATDKLVVSRKHPGARVDVELNFTNGHACTFDGSAYWSRDRLVANSSTEPACELRLFFFDEAVHTSAADACSALCGTRGTLDGAVLKKSARH